MKLVAIILATALFILLIKPSFAEITITTNGSEENVEVQNPSVNTQVDGGVTNTVTTNGDSGNQNVDTSNQSNGGGSITITTNGNSDNVAIPNNSSQSNPSPTPKSETNSVSNQNTTKVSNSPTPTIILSPTHFKPTVSIAPRVNKFKHPITFFSKIWKDLKISIFNFFHRP